MKQRIITAAVVLLLLGLVIYIGQTALLVTIFLLNALALYEYMNAITNEKKISHAVIPVILGSALITTMVCCKELFVTVFAIGVLVLFIADILTGHYDAMRSVYSVWGLIYVSVFFSFAAAIVMGGKYGIFLIITSIACCIACDSTAYFVGMKFGKRKLCPAISPKKSVEGAIGGFTGSVLASLIAYFVMPEGMRTGIGENSWIYFLMGGILIGIVGQFGDLAASMIKRQFGIKDYGDLLPGHGGVLDRIDSILFAFAIAYAYLNILTIL